MSRDLQDILIRHWLFSVLPGRVLADLANQFASKKYKKNQYVFHQEDRAKRLFVILDGEVSIETINIEGKVTKITHLMPGDIFGEFALIDEGRRSASARIIRPSVLASLPELVFQSLVRNHSEFSKKMLSVLVDRLRSSNQQVESLVTLTVAQRTARLLLQISEEHGPVIRTSQRELADRLFATREKVNGKLKAFERLGAIRVERSKITVLNSQKLSDVLDL